LLAAIRNVSIVLATMLAICGWHYARVWQHFGKPLIGNWDPSLHRAWYQEPGYRTASWYGHFGESFISPLFSGRFGFADGVYSSLWGDGYCSGTIEVGLRPPWDYDLMNAGYVLALLPTLLIVAGMIIVATRFLRHPTPGGFLLLGLSSAFGVGILVMSLRVASYAQVKAFYALPALLPCCAFMAMGWQWATSRGPVFSFLIRAGFLAWLLTAGHAFWISTAKPLTWTMRGVDAQQRKNYSEATEYFSKALRLDSGCLLARLGLAEALANMGKIEEALREAERAAMDHPNEGAPQTQLGLLFDFSGHAEEAVLHFKRALAAAPGGPDTHQQLADCLTQLGRGEEVIAVYREGLRIHPLDHRLLNNLAWLLATGPEANLRDGAEAVSLAERACQLTRFSDPFLIGTLGAAYAEAGRFDEAIATAKRARDIALLAAQPEIAEKNRTLLERYEAHEPYHQALGPRR
jgi:tetratricopeptide (TPR) repeat protein